MHEQVQKQLDFLKSLVDGEEKRKEDCKKWNITYTPSRRKWVDIDNYNEYKREIEKNGDKNLLVMAKFNMNDCTLCGKILPFARREAHMSFGTYFLIHRTEDDCHLLMDESSAEIITNQ